MFHIKHLVWACNPKTGKWEPKIVTKTSTHLYQGSIIKIVVDGEAIEATENHPIWVVSGEGLEHRPACKNLSSGDGKLTPQGKWVDACNVKPGDKVLGRMLKEPVVSHVEHREETVQVYNFAVDELHTYAVGKLEMLVHNQSAFNAGNLRGLSRDELKRIDPHDFKKEILGQKSKEISKFNINVDKVTNEIILVPRNSGAGPNIPTGIKITDM